MSSTYRITFTKFEKEAETVKNLTLYIHRHSMSQMSFLLQWIVWDLFEVCDYCRILSTNLLTNHTENNKLCHQIWCNQERSNCIPTYFNRLLNQLPLCFWSNLKWQELGQLFYFTDRHRLFTDFPLLFLREDRYIWGDFKESETRKLGPS